MREEPGHRMMAVVVGAALVLGGLIAVCTGVASGSKYGRWEVTGWPGRVMGMSMIAAGVAVLRAAWTGDHEDVLVGFC